MVITADCGSANPGSIPGGGNFLLSLFITFNIFHFIIQAYFCRRETNQRILKRKVFEEFDFTDFLKSSYFKSEKN